MTTSNLGNGVGGGSRQLHPPWRRSRTLSALNEPLPVASILAGQWKGRRKIHRTPRKLATLSTAPGGIAESGLPEDTSGTLLCIAGDEYIVVANTVSHICVYRLTEACLLHQADDALVAPWATVALTTAEDKSAPIVSLVALPFGKSLIHGESCRPDEGQVVAFSDDGRGFVLCLQGDVGATKLCDFNTLNFGVTCSAVVSTVAPDSSVDRQLIVGYQTGYLESWKIFRFSTDKIMAKLVWRGVYPNSNWIQDVAPLNLEHTASNGGAKKTATGGMDPARYLLLTLLPQASKQPLKSSAMVEVIDIGSFANDWKRNQESGVAAHGHGHLRAIDLGTRWIMPQAGMEILNSTTVSTSDDDPSGTLPKRAHFIPSTATGSICGLAQENCVALADGTIAMISSRERQDELQWGIANDYNQLLLPYPAIGCAPLNWGTSQHGDPNYRPHVACCLRGGSTYLLPFVEPERDAIEEPVPVTVLTLDAETHSRYIHGFTAGNLILSGDDSKKTTAPVLIYGWAGGIIDVFSCDLTGATPCRPMIGPCEVSALEELVSNGSIGILACVLSSMEDTDPLLLQPLWKKAREESTRASLEGITARDLVQPKFSGIQSLLLLLSTAALDVQLTRQDVTSIRARCGCQ